MVKRILLTGVFVSFSPLITNEQPITVTEPSQVVQQLSVQQSPIQSSIIEPSTIQRPSLQQLPTDQSKEPARWGNFIKNFAGTVAIGTLVGAAYGASCGYLESKSAWVPFLFPISWLVFSAMRNATIEAVDGDMKKNNINAYPTTLKDIAWVTDWVAYVYMSHQAWANRLNQAQNALNQINNNLANNYQLPDLNLPNGN